MRVLDVKATREIDRRASEEFGIPGLVLMENAALGAVEALSDLFPSADRVALFCGPGNNGGDGLAMARHLDLRGLETRVWLAGKRPLSGDAAVQEAICRRQGVDLRRLATADDLATELPSRLEGWDVLVDALFGVGLSRPLDGLYADLVRWINRQSAPCLAIDLPSGLSGDAAAIAGVRVEAAATVTFETPKPAHVMPPACDAVGELIVADLGIPPLIAAEVPGDMLLVTPEVAAGWLSDRPRGSHKGDFGHVLVAAGSTGMGGAAVLAARGAVRGGAGLVTCAVPEPVLATVDAASLESMTLGLAVRADGSLAPEAAASILAAAAERDVLALGPGLGQGQSIADVVLEVLAGADMPVVLDASGLAALGTDLAVVENRAAPTVLTPHVGELARLLGEDPADVAADRLAFARRAAAAAGCTVLLKGQATLVVDEQGVTVNTTGNPGMATGGTGDVLTGLIGALLASGLGPGEAAALGAFIHGAAGDLAAEDTGETALAASDLLAHLPTVLQGLEAS